MLATWENKLRNQLYQRGIQPFFVITNIPNEQELASLEDKIATLCKRIALVAWRTAERNLDYPAVMLSNFVCGEKVKAFRKQGGIEGILFRTQRCVEYRKPLLYGAATLAVCKNLHI